MEKYEKILLSHGSGGKLTHELIKELFLSNFDNPALRPLKDSAIVKIGKEKLAFTTDSFVVDPIFFPGGDIGSLSIHGTVNDLAVVGAKPMFISCGMIIEEGFDKDSLAKIVRSMKLAAKKADVEIVTGDTKVVGKGSADKIFINTSGIGLIKDGINLSTGKIRSGDVVIMSGTIGDHGAAILSKRKGLEFETTVKSDSASLNRLIDKILSFKSEVRFMRDPTRGGVATTLNEIVQEVPYGIELHERSLPFHQGTRALGEILGIDPLYFPNEGRVVAIVSEKFSTRILRIMKSDPLGRGSKIIGRVIDEHKNMVILKTEMSGSRLLEMLSSEQLPRIC
jgi:hydrogenase expression/formation protein HypE